MDIYYYNIQGHLTSLINENFDTLPTPDYPNIDNILVTNDSCVWTIDRNSSPSSIIDNQTRYRHCNEFTIDVDGIQQTNKLQHPEPPIPTLPPQPTIQPIQPLQPLQPPPPENITRDSGIFTAAFQTRTFNR